MFRQLPLLPVLTALAAAAAASVWTKFLGFGPFPTLVLSAILFFGIYALALTLWKEPMTLEVEKQVTDKLLHRRS